MAKVLGTSFGHGVPARHETTDQFSCTRGVGIEIEIENVTGDQMRAFADFRHWRTTRDGSLRDGVELISNVVWGRDLGEALDEAFAVINENNVTWRCGLHVHVDVRDKNVRELHSICSMYATLERAMFLIEGNDRHTSRFCVPWYSQPAFIASVAAACIKDDVRNMDRGAKQMGKYSALNLMPISRQGSVEFRQALMDHNKRKVTEWILLCQAIVEHAGTHKSTDILMEISKNGPVDAIRGIIGDPMPSLYKLTNFSESVWQGVDIANLLEAEAMTEAKNVSNEGRCDYSSIVKRIKSKK